MILIERLRDTWNPSPELMLEAADELEKLTAERDALKADNENYKTVMMAAAVEITEHWDAHCDSEGFGPANLVRRLENCYPAQYGYDAQTVVRMEKRIAEIEAESDVLKAMYRKVRDELAAEQQTNKALRTAAKLGLDALGVATTPLAKDRQEVLRAITALRGVAGEQDAT